MRKVFNVDIINEDTSGAGVTIEGVRFSNGSMVEQAGGIALKKYESTVTFAAGVETSKTTTVDSIPLTILLLNGLTIVDATAGYFTLVGGVYVFTMYSESLMTDVKIKILY